MVKPTSLAGLKQLEKDIESDRRDYIRKEITSKLDEYRNKLYKENNIYLKAYDDKLDNVRKEIIAKEKELSEKAKKIPEELDRYVRYKWASGIDFGYGGVSVRYLDPQNRFLIITENGSTAGTGTAMGTGGYYYAQCEHFITFPQYGCYLEAYLPHNKGKEYGERSNNKMFEVEGGRLTNAIKKSLIEQAEAYCEKYKVEPFELPVKK